MTPLVDSFFLCHFFLVIFVKIRDTFWEPPTPNGGAADCRYISLNLMFREWGQLLHFAGAYVFEIEG